MNSKIQFTFYSKVSKLPENWNSLAVNNIFLSKEYLEVLEKSAPNNMSCFFIGFYIEDNLVGIALSQFLNLNLLKSFGDRDKCVKSSVRNFIFKNFCSHVLLIGNNMLTGQNAFAFSEGIDKKDIALGLLNAMNELKANIQSSGKKVHITSLKDYENTDIVAFEKELNKDYFQFFTQPNMVFTILENWKTEQDYINALSKKYRDQYKRARKKAAGIEKRKLNLQEIIALEDEIYELYFHVAQTPRSTLFS